MKPSAYLYEYHETGIVRSSLKHPNEFDKTLASEFITHLYTAAEIADFVKGLYFDDNWKLDKDRPVFAQIAERIEEEGKK